MRLPVSRSYAERDARGKENLYADILLHQACRNTITEVIIRELQAERERSKEPGYVCTYGESPGEM